MTAPVLVFGYGNPSRGDDALGPEFVRRVEVRCSHAIAAGQLEVLTDFQLQVEDVLELRGRQRVFFVDSSVEGSLQFVVRPVSASKDVSFTSHVLSPAALLHSYWLTERAAPPPAWMVAIRGERFGLGEAMSEAARRNLKAALDAVVPLLPH